MKHYIGKKIIAALIDYSIIVIIDFYLIFALGEPVAGEPESYELNGFPALITILPWFIFTICLEYFLGSTLGNGIVGLKPVPQDNPNIKVTFIQSLQRHLLDPIDMSFLGLVGYLVMKSNTKGAIIPKRKPVVTESKLNFIIPVF